MAAAARSPSALPQVEGFSVLRRLDAGGMGVVYLARARDGRRVALKMVDERVAGDDAALRRFAYEGRWTRELSHPHVLPIQEVVEHEGATVLVMEYVPGRTLAHLCAGVEPPRLPSGERLLPRRLVELAADVADGLHHAHEHGIVHRDVKPANILVRDDGHAFLIDFGIARHLHLDANSTLTRTGQLLGTPQYMAPEQIEGDRERVDARTDVYGLAASLYAALVGSPPFVETDLARLARAIREDEPPHLPRVAGVPEGLDAVLQRALEKSPAHRYPSAAALADDLRRVARGQRPHASVASLWLRRGWRRVRRHRVRVAAGAAALLAVVVLVLAGAHADQRGATEAERLLGAAREAVEAGSLAEAVALCEQAAAADPGAVEPWRVLAGAYARHEHYRAAREALDEARARGYAPRDDARASGADLAALALVDLQERRIGQAADLLGRAVARDPSLFDAYFLLAGQLELLERDEEARDAFARYLDDLKPRNPRRVVVQARLAQLAGRPDDAVAALEAQVAQHPEQADALARDLGQAYLRLSAARGHADDALLRRARDAFLAATAGAGRDLTSWINLGEASLLLDDAETARLALRRASAFEAELPSQHQLAAHLAAHGSSRVEDVLEAERAIDRALGLPGAWAALHDLRADLAFRRSQLLREAQRYDEERAALEQALAHAPAHPGALMMLAFVQWFDRDLPGALETSGRALDALARSPSDAYWRRLVRTDDLLGDVLVARLDAAARSGQDALADEAAARLRALDATAGLRPETALNLAEALVARGPREAAWVRALVDGHALHACFDTHPQARPILDAIETRLAAWGAPGPVAAAPPRQG